MFIKLKKLRWTDCYIPEIWRMDTPNVFLMKLLIILGVSSYQISGT